VTQRIQRRDSGGLFQARILFAYLPQPWRPSTVSSTVRRASTPRYPTVGIMATRTCARARRTIAVHGRSKRFPSRVELLLAACTATIASGPRSHRPLNNAELARQPRVSIRTVPACSGQADDGQSDRLGVC